MDGDDTGNRRKKRDSLFLSAKVTIVDGAPFDTRVRNLSSGGMMIDVAVDYPVGTQLIAVLRGLDEIPGHIAWCTVGRAGVAFDREIDPSIPRATPSGTKGLMPDYLRPIAGRRPGLAIR